MKRILLRSLTVMTAALFSIYVDAQDIQRYDDLTLIRTNDGRELKGTMVKLTNGLEKFAFVNELPYTVLADKANNLFILNKATMDLVTEVQGKADRFRQVTRDGYLLDRGNLVTTKRVPEYYNFKNEKLWAAKQNLIIADRLRNIAICEEMKAFKDQQNQTFIAYDMSTGKELWRLKLPHHYHYLWADMRIDDEQNQYYLKADSLIRLNILTGDTVRRPFAAGIDEPLKSKLSIVRRKMLNRVDWMNEARYSYGSLIANGVLTGTHSNWLERGDSLIIADAKGLTCFDQNLNTIWHAAFPEGVGAKSELTVDGNRLLLINYGVAFQNGILARCGKPFVATYDIKTGKEQMLTMPSLKKKLTGGCFVPGRAYWQDDKGFSYTDKGDTTAMRIPWKPKTNQEPNEYHPDYYICDTVGVVKDGTLQLLTTNKDQLIVELYGKDVYLVHTDGSAEMIAADKVFFHDGRGLYSTNAEKNTQFIVVPDRNTCHVALSFSSDAKVRMDKAGNILLGFKDGAGVISSKAWREK